MAHDDEPNISVMRYEPGSANLGERSIVLAAIFHASGDDGLKLHTILLLLVEENTITGENFLRPFRSSSHIFSNVSFPNFPRSFRNDTHDYDWIGLVYFNVFNNLINVLT